MVSIIELDREDGDRIKGLSLKLTEGTESLSNRPSKGLSGTLIWVMGSTVGRREMHSPMKTHSRLLRRKRRSYPERSSVCQY